jgi:hypothetical protein
MTASTDTAYTDARVIAKGIRLGGSREIVAALEAALVEGPLTPDRIEQVAHPDWDRIQFEEHASEPVAEGARPVGLCRLYDPVQMGAAPRPASWGVAAAWWGFLPGAYASREAALLAYGYVLGREGAGMLEELRDTVLLGEGRPIEAADLIAFAERDEVPAPVTHSHTADDWPDGSVILCCTGRVAGGKWRFMHLAVGRAVWFEAGEELRNFYRRAVRHEFGDPAAHVTVVEEPDA